MAKYKRLGCALSVAALALGSGILAPAAFADGEYDLAGCLMDDNLSTCELTGDAVISERINIVKDKIINLNDHNVVTADSLVVDGANVEIIGEGTVGSDTSTIPLRVWGTNDAESTAYSVLTVGKDVTVTSNESGWGVFVPNAHNDGKAFGVVINFGGSLVAGNGFTINGNIQQNSPNAPKINILDGASVKATSGHAVYAAGYGHWTIGEASIEGVGGGVGLKSGTFVFNNSDIKGTGPYVEPVGYNNGINNSGATIQIEANDSYADNVEITINGGSYTSVNGHVVYEYKSTVSTIAKVKSIVIKDGVFISGKGKDIFQVSDGFGLTGFVSGGTYHGDSFDPSYLAEGYSAYEKPRGVWTVDGTEDADLPDNIVIAKGESYTIEPGEIIAKYLTGGTDNPSIATSDDLTITGVAAGETVFGAQLYEIGKDVSEKQIPVYVYDLDDKNADVNLEITSEQKKKEYIEEKYEGAVAALAEVAEKNNKKIAAYYDIGATLNTNDDNISMEELGKPALIVFDLPDNLPSVEKGLKRRFFMIRFHNNEASELIPVTDNGDGAGSFENDRFSAFVLVYEDVEEEDEEVVAETPDTGTVTVAGASAMSAALVSAVAVGIITAITSFAYLIRKK